MLPSVLTLILYWIFFIPESEPGITTLGRMVYRKHKRQDLIKLDPKFDS